MSTEASHSANPNVEPAILVAYGAGSTTPSELHPEHNEDAYLASYNTQTFAVFDGVGGREGSAEAAKLALKKIYGHFEAQAHDQFDERVATAAMAHAFIRAHDSILRKGTGIATTAAALRLFTTPEGKQRVQFAHTGDSRIYRLREGEPLRAMTLDDTPFTAGMTTPEAWYMQRKLSDVISSSRLTTVAQQAAFKKRYQISAALGLGTFDHVKDTIRSAPVEKSDRFVLTSDGIHDNLTTQEIEMIVKSARDPKTVARTLVHAAKSVSRSGSFRAKPDDMTAVVVNISAKK